MVLLAAPHIPGGWRGENFSVDVPDHRRPLPPAGATPASHTPHTREHRAAQWRAWGEEARRGEAREEERGGGVMGERERKK
eukprot:2987833-Rhodomonas_salina.1